jgi:tetratricopeptide (TPR) repeat protein
MCSRTTSAAARTINSWRVPSRSPLAVRTPGSSPRSICSAASRPIEAAENFDRATKADPKNAQAWHHLALACSHQQRWQSQGIEAIQQAVGLEKMNVSYLKMAGKLHAAAGMTAEAERYYNEALTWGGEDPAIRQALEDLSKGKKPRPGIFGRLPG